MSKTLTKTNKERCVEENLEHDEVGGPPGQHDDGLVGQGGVHHLVDWLIDRLIGWLIDWLVGWLVLTLRHQIAINDRETNKIF